jgi:thioredoxin 1
MKTLRLLMCLVGLGLGMLLLTSPDTGWSKAPPSGKPSIYEFASKFCPYCWEMAEILKDVEKQYPGQITVHPYYIETSETLFKEYGVSVTPTLIFFDASGRQVYRHEGLFSKDKLVSKLKELRFIRD